MVCMVSGVCFRNGTLAHSMGDSVSQDAGVGPSMLVLSIPLNPVCLIVWTSEPKCYACGLVHKWINQGLRSLWATPKSITIVSAWIE